MKAKETVKLTILILSMITSGLIGEKVEPSQRVVFLDIPTATG